MMNDPTELRRKQRIKSVLSQIDVASKVRMSPFLFYPYVCYTILFSLVITFLLTLVCLYKSKITYIGKVGKVFTPYYL